MLDIISYIIIGIGIIFMIFGLIGVYRFDNFYPRIIAGAKVDTVGVITVIVGVAIRHGISFFTAKVLLIMVIMLIISPLVTHIITRSAYVSGYPLDTKKKENE